MKRLFRAFGILTIETGDHLFWKKSTLSKYQLHSYLASGSRESTIKIWNICTGECIKTFNCQSRVLCLALIPNRPDELVSGLGNGTIIIWNIKSGDLSKKFKGLYKIILDNFR